MNTLLITTLYKQQTLKQMPLENITQQISQSIGNHKMLRSISYDSTYTSPSFFQTIQLADCTVTTRLLKKLECFARLVHPKTT